MTRPPGRPKAANPRREQRALNLPLTEDEHAMIAALAARWKVSRSEATRRALRQAYESEG